MTFQKLTYQLARGTVSGYIANRAINFTARPSQPGSSPPTGNYTIHPPTNDPIYGKVALMVPTGAFAGNVGGGSGKISPTLEFARPSNSLTKGVLYIKSKDSQGNSVFVLTSKPITGQNSLVVTSGFADLMDALQAAGGALVTVS